MKVTIEYLIQQPYMNNVKVLCAQNHLRNVVDGISFLEGGSNRLMLLKNTMIMSDTASFLGMPEAELETLLDAYSKTRVSAVCLRSNVDKANLHRITTAAARRNIPVLLLPEDTIISSVISGINYEFLYSSGYDLTHSYEDNFIQEMIFAEQDTKMILHRARMMGIRVNEFLCVIMIMPSKNVNIHEFMHQCKIAWGGSSLACTRNNTVMLIGRLTVQYELANKLFHEMAENMAEKLRQKYTNIRITIGIGHCYANVVNLRSSYFNAKTAILAAISNSFQKDVVFYDQLGIYKVLFDIKNRESVYAIRSEIIGPIVKYDHEHQTDFFNTISTYFDSFCSVQDTSKKLNVHYNTIRYRLQKIKEELGWDLFQMEDCTNLVIGIQLNHFLTAEETSTPPSSSHGKDSNVLPRIPDSNN